MESQDGGEGEVRGSRGACRGPVKRENGQRGKRSGWGLRIKPGEVRGEGACLGFFGGVGGGGGGRAGARAHSVR
jgi:hypothetical protein